MMQGWSPSAGRVSANDVANARCNECDAFTVKVRTNVVSSGRLDSCHGTLLPINKQRGFLKHDAKRATATPVRETHRSA
jgi:hypothetical protein